MLVNYNKEIIGGSDQELIEYFKQDDMLYNLIISLFIADKYDVMIITNDESNFQNNLQNYYKNINTHPNFINNCLNDYHCITINDQHMMFNYIIYEYCDSNINRSYNMNSSLLHNLHMISTVIYDIYSNNLEPALNILYEISLRDTISRLIINELLNEIHLKNAIHYLEQKQIEQALDELKLLEKHINYLINNNENHKKKCEKFLKNNNYDKQSYIKFIKKINMSTNISCIYLYFIINYFKDMQLGNILQDSIFNINNKHLIEYHIIMTDIENYIDLYDSGSRISPYTYFKNLFYKYLLEK